MKRLIIAALAVCSASCSLLRANIPGGSALPDVGVGDVVEAKRQADECAKFESAVVAYPEEVSIGGAIALDLGNKPGAGPSFIELSPEVMDLDFKALMDKFKNTKPQQTGAGVKTDLNHYVNLVGKGLAAFSERPGIEWTFSVLDSETANAFSAPGGYVFITTAMLKKVDNEAQLAGVLAHEIGHVTGRHTLKTYQSSKKTACLAAYATGKAVSVGTSMLPHIDFADEVLQVLKLPVFDPNKLGAKFITFLADGVGDMVAKGMDPELEKEADATATRLMIFAGYDSREFEKVLLKLPDGGGFLGAHPPTKARIEVITATRTEFADFAASNKAPALGASVNKALK